MSNASRFRLHQADAIYLLKSLPSASIDMIDTDVAYESLEKHRAVGTTTRLKESDGSSNEWFEIFRNARFPEFFEESYRVLKKNAHLYFFCDGETSRVAIPIAEAAGFTFWNELVWAKTKGISSADTLEKSDLKIGMGYHYRRCKEYVLFFEKGKRKLNNLGIGDVLPFPPVRNGYPTEKPVELHKVLIGQSTEPGEIVCDPFMGSGSAGNAAVRLGRSFIGGDLKEKAVALTRKTLIGAGAKEDPDLIPPRGDEPEPPPKKMRTKKAPPAEPAIEAAPDKEFGPWAVCPRCGGGVLCAEPVCETCGFKLTMMPSAAERLSASSPGEQAVERLKDPPILQTVAVPRQGFVAKVSDAPLPAMSEPGVVAQLEEAHTQTEGYLAAIASAPPKPVNCHHGEPRSACILCRARR